MESLCSGCDLRCTIENYKKELNNIIYKKKQNLLDNEVISISQSLDEFLYKCVLCRQDFNKIDVSRITFKPVKESIVCNERASLVRIYDDYDCMNESNYVNVDNLCRVLDDSSYSSRNSDVEYENCM